MIPHSMLRLILLLTALAAAVPAAAVTLTEGVEYERLATPEPTHDPQKIEVLEVFSYGCIHCFHLESTLHAWQARLPADVELQYLPAVFQPQAELYARGFYAAAELGQLAATHARVFDALWNGHMPIRSLGDLANLYAGLGLDRARFIDAAQSPENRAAVDAAKEKIMRLKVDGTPAIFVAGRYRVLLTLISTSEELLQRVDAVVAMEREARQRRH